MAKKIAVFVAILVCVLVLARAYSHTQDQRQKPIFAATAQNAAPNTPVPSEQAPAAPAPIPDSAENGSAWPDAASADPAKPGDTASSSATVSAPASDRATTALDPLSGEPPIVNVGLTVEQAYAALPHRRTVWDASNSTAAPDEQAYLGTIFKLVDQAIAVKVAGLQNYSRGDFTSVDIDAQYEALLNYASAMNVPSALTTYHQDILAALSNEREFFRDWNADRTNSAFTAQFQTNPQVQAASAASRAGYGELMRAFPNEPAVNKGAFYDYHCALDFL
ncbi:MAG TPA: hypothetical protein VFW94_20180 [Candidatus Acidoferrales bacterium]|nr:hypothetical protein [Candidatus Acidoferrales bacterium]